MNKKDLEDRVSEDEYVMDELELVRRMYEGLPVRTTVKVKRCGRYNLKTGLPMDELERISALRVWAPLRGLPRDPKKPDDFEPALPDIERFGG